MTKNRDLEIYIHIPFCVKKCNYCDFLSAPGTGEQQKAYMGALFAEIQGFALQFQDYQIVSVFIGGGTPSILEAEWITALLQILRNSFRLTEDVEISMEINPGTVDWKKLNAYREAGINRISIGLQSANNEELKRLGRIHTYEHFLTTYRLARETGFRNINVDIMSALPGQSVASYQRTLQRILELSPLPEHISAYSLIVEEGTLFDKWDKEGTLDLPDEDCERVMYEETKKILEKAGYYRYEISNYAKRGFECRHNCGYWRRREYVGFGIGAASLLQNQRFSNSGNLQEYCGNPFSIRVAEPVLSVEEQMEETMFLGLRMTKGLKITEFRDVYGKTMEAVYGDVIYKNVRDGLLIYAQEEDGEYLRLTERGLDISNYVMSQFILD